MAMKFPHVQTGERVVNPAALENAKRDLVNRFGDVGVGTIGSGFRNAPQWIPCYNAGSFAIKAGRAVNIKWDASGEDANAAQDAGLVCVKAYDTLEEQLGIARDDIEVGEMGMVAFHGVVKAQFYSGVTPVAGGRYWAGYDGSFVRQEAGFLWASGGFIDLDSGNQHGCLKVYALEYINTAFLHLETGVARNAAGAYPVKKGAKEFRNGGWNAFPLQVSHLSGEIFFLPCRESFSGTFINTVQEYGSYVDLARNTREVDGAYRMLWRYGSEYLAFRDDSHPNKVYNETPFGSGYLNVSDFNPVCRYRITRTAVIFTCDIWYNEHMPSYGYGDFILLRKKTRRGGANFADIEGSVCDFVAYWVQANGTLGICKNGEEPFGATSNLLATIYIDGDRDNDVSVIVWTGMPIRGAY